MLALIVAAQITAANPAADSTLSSYTSQALRDAIAIAAVSNRASPEALAAYRARLESELSFVIRDSLGRERAGQIEQLASAAAWARSTGYEVHVAGYRAQSLGVPFSALSIVRGWTVPMLYGQRLLLGIEPSGATGVRIVRRGERRDTIVAVHPFASDRDRFYRFSGGDTVTVIRSRDRAIPIVRIRVRPNFAVADRFAAFDGEIHLDILRHEIVRMRGRFLERIEADSGAGAEGGRRSLFARIMGVVAVAYVEFVNAEVGGRYWLPLTQRIEFQASAAVFGDLRSIFRIVSRFSEYEIDDTTNVAGLNPSIGMTRRRITYAPSDSLSTYTDWRSELGSATTGVASDDFDDLAPRSWRREGPPHVSFFPSAFDQLFRFNRVEGLFTGASATVDLRDAAPGLTLRGQIGWAWTEKTARGGLGAYRRAGNQTFGVRAERSLSNTNDFPLDLGETGGSFGAMFGSVDNFDYVDRSRAIVSSSIVVQGVDVGLATLQFGVGRDRAEVARLSQGWVDGPNPFRPNRGAADGSYTFAIAEAELHPNVTGDFLQPGAGARLRYEGATGGIGWHRVEIMGTIRRYFGPLSLGGRVDAGTVIADVPPPQTLFELGGNERLPGYGYKEFAGDRAALFRVFSSYALPFKRAPMRFGRIFVPGISPGLAMSAQGGWAELTSDGAREAVLRMGMNASGTGEPVSRATGRVRASIGGGLTFFGGLLHVGAARPIDVGAKWRWSAGFGPTF
jgi:hypothetical protein